MMRWGEGEAIESRRLYRPNPGEGISIPSNPWNRPNYFLVIKEVYRGGCACVRRGLEVLGMHVHLQEYLFPLPAKPPKRGIGLTG